MNKQFFPKILLLFLSTLACTVFHYNISAQSPDFSSVRNQFDNYRNKVLQEKIYGHTDKSFYLAGELLWFKLYNVDASFHDLLDVSKVAYVEILNRDHVPLLQTKISMADGTGNGSFNLPTGMPSGNYIFRAYTNWMKNFDADFYFEKAITIINTIKNEIAETKVSNMVYDLQFFPEGGNLVNGIESTVAFRMVDQYGKGINCNGVIINQNGDTISRYQTLKSGIGSFRFLPVKNSSYKAVAALANGSTIVKELPTSYEQGYVLHVKKLGNNKVSVRVDASDNFNTQSIYLFIHCRQQIVEAANTNLNNNVAEFIIDENRFSEGISHITIFNASKQPVCERLLFKRPTHQLFIEGSSSQQQYESRKKINIDIQTRDEAGNIQPANLSVSVYRLDSAAQPPQENIASYLWLSSDLKGNIESPEYYLNNTDAVAEQAVDNLMLTHGWRRFKWEDILQTKNFSFSFIPEYQGHIIPARVVYKETKLPANNIQSYLSIPGSYFQFYTARSNEKGDVNFFTRNLYSGHEIFAQAGGKDRAFLIDLKNPFSENFSSRLPPIFSLASYSGVMLQAKSVDMQVQKVFFANKLNKILNPSIDTTSFYEPTRTYFLDNYVRFPTMEEVLREYVQEIAVIKQNNSLILAAGRKSDVTGIVYRYEPLTMVDGIPLLDNPNKIFSFDPLKVKALDIINKKYFLGTASFEGIINFRTYTGRPEGLEIDPNATVLDYEGLQLQREFFNPVYETQAQVSSRMPDFRSLLFWSPSLKTNTSGKQQVSFYTSDLAGKYIVRIEGLAPGGRAGSRVFYFDVINPLLVQK